MATILIVDDRPPNREFLVTLLGYGGHRLLEAADGAEGLTVARAERPDLVIADILMPTMDGYEFVRQLRADPAVADTRVIFCTAHYHEPEARSLAAACGVRDVLTKPCEPEEVLRVVESALSGVLDTVPAPSQADELSFDRDHLALLTDKLTQKADELRRTNERLTALVELGLRLGSERDQGRLLQVFCDSARQIVGARYAVVGIPSKGEVPYRHFMTSGMDLATAARVGRLEPLVGVLGSVLTAGHCFRAANHGRLAAAGLPPALSPAAALLAAPLLSPTRVHGWVCLLDKLGADEFTEQDEQLARMLGAQVGRIYENGSLYVDLLQHSTKLAEEVADRRRAEEEVRRTTKLLRAVADGTTDAVFVKSHEGKYLFLNESMARLVGKPVAAVLGRDDTALFDPESAQLVIDRDRRVMVTGVGETEEEELTAAGITRTYLTTKGPYRDSEGNVIGVIGISHDVTERKRAERRLATQYAVVNILASAANLQEAAPRILRAVCETKGWELGDLWVIDKKPNILSCAALWPSEGERFAEFRDMSRQLVLTPGRGLPGRVWVSKRATWVEDVTTDPDFPRAATAAKAGLRVGFAFPILFNNEVLGIVEFFGRPGRQSDAHQLRMFESLGSQIGQFVERKRGEQALAESARLASLVGDIGFALTQSDSLPDVLRLCAEALVRNLGAAFARIWTLNGAAGVLELQASAGMYTHLNGPHGRVPVGQFKIGRIAQERRPHLTNAVVGDPHVGNQEWAQREGMVAFAGYPLLVDQRLVGVVALFARHTLNDAVLGSLASIADQIALGIDRMRTEWALQVAQQRLEQVVTSSPSVLFTLAIENDKIRGLSWISENVRELFDFSAQESLEPSWWRDHIHPEDRERILAHTPTELFASGRVTHEYRFRCRDGTYRWTRGEIRLIRDATGRAIEAVGSWSDITHLRDVEEQYRQAQKMEAVGRLAAGVAHDFNNLLTVINGFSEVVLERLSSNDGSRELLREIVNAGQRAAGLTRQLLAFSRKAIIEPRQLDLEAVVTDVEKMLRRIIGEDIHLAITSDPDLGTIRADPGQVEQVLLNLVVNARDAMPTGGRITIELQNAALDEEYARNHPDARSGSYVMLAVTDTGCGMSAETVARIFEPFFSTKAERGTGLGLATVHGIVKQSGGHVGVYSEVGVGSTFRVYFPRVEKQEVAPSERATKPTFPRGNETILLAEDEDAVRALARHILRECGYTVLDARDGTDALRVAAEHPGGIDLLVTDVVMPQTSGRELVVRLSETRPGLKVLFLSGYTDDAIVRHGILEAEVAFLQKPFTGMALAQKVREVLDKR